MNRRDQRFALLLLAPAAVLVLSIAVYPIARVVWLSFFAQNLGTGLEPELVGAANYVRLLHDGHFWQSIRTTFVFTIISVALELLLGLGFALLLNAKFRGCGFARAAALVPWALPTAVLALAWTWIFNDQFGVLNDLLMRVGIIARPIAWLAGGDTAMAALIFADVWKTAPFIMIILLAGLQNIPEELYEAAAIDGARAWQRFTQICRC
jgi:multiple sugar transport system permease protein